jgi:hypothetical protein
LVRAATVQRKIGWAGSTGWNKGKGTLGAAHKMVRIPLADLPHGNTAPSPNPEKTDEKADSRAIAWIHPGLDPKKPVQVVVHLHGLTYRADDPFAGWRENNADPKTNESDESKAAHEREVRKWEAAVRRAKRAKPPQTPPPAPAPWVNPLGNTVRDVERDRIGEQIEALDDPQMMAVLPQGSGLGGAGAFGANFDAKVIVDDVLTRLKAEGELKAVPDKYTIVLSAHSGGGAVVADALKAGRTTAVGGLILFDALWGQPDDKDPTVTASPQRRQLLAWIRRNCKAAAPALRGAKPGTDAAKAAIEGIPGVRGLWEAGYSNTYENLQASIDAVVNDEIPAPHVAEVQKRFVITKLGLAHDRMVGGSGTKGREAAPLKDALSQRGAFVSRLAVQRDPSAAPKTAKVTLKWTGEVKNQTQLQPVLTAHRADLTANVMEGGKVVATGVGTATFEVKAIPATHRFKIVPTAAAPGDYFLAKSTSVTVTADATKEASVTLPYNRENVRFTERTWEAAGIDVTKANDVKPATLFGKSVGGGLNTATATKVTATNNWFNTNVSAADQKAARDSIMSMVGRVKRTQSRGTYSNHSTGVAIDINPSNESLQNWHVTKGDKRHAKAMKVFNTVVSKPSMFDSLVTRFVGLAFPGVGDLSPFAGFDVWKERDRDRLLLASERFNAFFPQYLLDLVSKADPTRTPAPTTTSVMSLSAADLRALARAATRSKQPAVADSLRQLADVWFEVRAWVGAYVITNKKKGGEPVGMLRADFEKAKAKDTTLQEQGELKGMISLHPALVKALTETGWSWMVDYRRNNEKDFMHFEDRQAEQALKK